MSKELESLLKEACEGMLTEDTLKAITESFTAAVEAKVSTEVDLRIEAALAKMDEDHTQMLEGVLSKIDEDHTTKLKSLVQKLDESYAAKLQTVLEKQDEQMTAIAEQYKQQVIDKVSDFLELALEEAIPSQMVEEAVQNTRSRSIVSEIKKLVALDETFINANVEAALKDGRKQIDESKAALDKALQQLSVLTEQNNTLKTQQLLSEKTANLTAAKKDYVLRATKGKDAKFIMENFNDIVKMFDKEQTARASLLKEEAQKEVLQKVPDASPAPKETAKPSGTAVYLEGFN